MKKTSILFKKQKINIEELELLVSQLILNNEYVIPGAQTKEFWLGVFKEVIEKNRDHIHENSRLIADLDANRGYSGIPTFLRSNICKNLDNIDATYAVLGVPYDEGFLFGGSRFCARSIREHSLRFGGGDL